MMKQKLQDLPMGTINVRTGDENKVYLRLVWLLTIDLPHYLWGLSHRWYIIAVAYFSQKSHEGNKKEIKARDVSKASGKLGEIIRF